MGQRPPRAASGPELLDVARSPKIAVPICFGSHKKFQASDLLMALLGIYPTEIIQMK